MPKTYGSTHKWHILLVILIMSLNTLTVSASSQSSSYSLQDEALDFSHNSDQLKSSSYTMDLSTVFWTNRIGESASYSIIDANSGESQTVSPPSSGGGSTGVIAGGRREIVKGESDTANLIALEEIEVGDNGLSLHPAPEKKDVIKPRPQENKPVVEVEKILKKEHKGDTDGCSPSFEWTYLKTNTVENDSDGDGISDCDEALIYGLDPLKYNDSYGKIGLSKFIDIVYSQSKPLLIGRGDFNLVETYSENLIQIEVQMDEPATDLGLFFMQLDQDLNFAEILPVDLFDGRFKTTLFRDGNKQPESDYIIIDQTFEFIPIQVSIPDNGKLDIRNDIVVIKGNTGPNYGVVAIWKGDNFIDVSADVADYEGKFDLSAPVLFADGTYEVILYGLVKAEDHFVQTNYQEVRFDFEEGNAFILAEPKEEIIPLWQAGYDFVDKELHSVNLVEIHDVGRESSMMYLVSYFIFLTFVGLTFYALWSKSRRSKYS